MDDRTKHRLFLAMARTSHLAGTNAAYLDRLYEHFLADPAAVDAAWRSYFAALPRVAGAEQDIPHAPIREWFRQYAKRVRRVPAAGVPPAHPAAVPAPLAPSAEGTQLARLRQLVDAYREKGHLVARFDPLEMREIPEIPELDFANHGFTEQDLDQQFDREVLDGEGQASLREIVAALRAVYCGTLGAEYMYILDSAERRWIQTRLERGYSQSDPPLEVKRQLLDRLTAAEVLERYLHKKYVGQKRFSLEGAESLIPLLDELIQRGGLQGVKEIAIGMAHRGRLNVLVNIMGKSPADLFLEFEGRTRDNAVGSGDVKYHMGFSSNIRTQGGSVHVALAFNPSHLEIVCPVVEGSVRARQERRNDRDGVLVVPVLIHGDAAFSGQGVIMETLNMSQSRGYSTKGTIHIVVNNQIGFTTSNQADARSTLYCSDVAKMVNAPIFHVNGDDPQAVLFAAQTALDYRMKFGKDVVIDLVCYRRHGHSEADEPGVTQPTMYARIREMKTSRDRYAERLAGQGIIGAEDAQAIVEKYHRALDAGECVAPNLVTDHEVYEYGLTEWRSFVGGERDLTLVDTSVAIDVIRRLSERLGELPEGFELHHSVVKIMDNRRKMAAGALPIDWGFAETLAYATLLNDGFAVRLSGQDSGRGTFFHRHATLYNQKDGEVYIPLRHLDERQPNFLVTNSLLSEEAVLAFEYGYATTSPRTLVIWEAQFGDFANNAQVVIDQFISAGEQKWNRLCGLVMFLPHGYEGQGPEHSSARLERYLQLCAEHNMQVCAPTTPAQIFHLLRRQMLSDIRKPLIVMTPKSLLRHKHAVSTLEDFSQGQFYEVLPDPDELDPRAVERVVLCSGKVFYDLLEKRRRDERGDVALVRLEQPYPFPRDALQRELERYPGAGQFVWCQEEPKNQGAWYSSQHHMRALIEPRAQLEYAGRPFSAAPAVGYPLLHIKQLCALVEDALGAGRARGQDAAHNESGDDHC